MQSDCGENMSRPTLATINASALRHNYALALASGRMAYAVIKSNAYGHGAVGVAKALPADAGLAVACVDEAIELRNQGISNPILVLQGWYDVAELRLMISFNLETVVHHQQQLKELKLLSKGQLVVWLKVDTGMHRLGFNPEDVKACLASLENEACVNEIRLMTHFSDADHLNSPTCAQQMIHFNNVTKDFHGKTSVANSAAILAQPNITDDYVRPGIMLYGVSPIEDKTASEFDLKPVMTLSSRVIALKNITRGESIGYGGSWVAQKDSHIAIIAVGYGDGYPRNAPSGTSVLMGGKKCPLVGRVSMDMITVDVSDLDSIAIGDEAVLWGEGLPIEPLAAATGTIAYELLCQVTARVPRKIS
jgi:alanine racemase